jgi:hypothetical protein
MFNEGIKYRFETIAEVKEWQKNHPSGGLYRDNIVWLGECREEDELYMEAHCLGISCQDLYDQKYGITRFDI